MKCLNCNNIVDENDNFCFKCGHWTTKGYHFFEDKKNIKKYLKGKALKQRNRMSSIFFLVTFMAVLLIIITSTKKMGIFKPFVYLKKEVLTRKYGYDISIIDTNKYYEKKVVNDLYDAGTLIKEDSEKQKWMCKNEREKAKLESSLEEKYDIKTVNFCDISTDTVQKITKIIEGIYDKFPSIKGVLTNISIANADEKNDYIALFQGINQFVNNNEDINEFNKVNKTQILLNSYYFLNDDTLNKNLSDLTSARYVKGADFYSLIAHEFGHLISFKIILNKYNLDSVALVTKENENIINQIKNEYSRGTYAGQIVRKALENYNFKNSVELSEIEFASKISAYAGNLDASNNIIYDEVIAEAVHDYYLHDNMSSMASLEIINILKEQL